MYFSSTLVREKKDETSHGSTELLVTRTTKRVSNAMQLHADETTPGYFVNTLSWIYTDAHARKRGSLSGKLVECPAREHAAPISGTGNTFRGGIAQLSLVRVSRGEDDIGQWAPNACNEPERKLRPIAVVFRCSVATKVLSIHIVGSRYNSYALEGLIIFLELEDAVYALREKMLNITHRERERIDPKKLYFEI